MDKLGRAITPIVTHQDRRSVQVAREMLDQFGQARFLRLSGNMPFPGSISSTTFAWHRRHAASLMRKADLVGHLSTFLHRQLTAARVTDPSNASFMGLFSTLKLSGWDDELCSLVGISRHILPDIHDANDIGARLTSAAAHRLGLPTGMPMIVGCMDTSAAFFLSSPRPGQLVNSCGSTDVLALCTDKPGPHPRLLTRALGTGRLWLSVSTLAAAGSALTWAHEQLFPDLPEAAFHKLLADLARHPLESGVRFEPYLAGDRMSIDQRQAAFVGLTLAATRRQMLSAIIESLAAASAERLPLLQEQGGVKISRSVLAVGGIERALGGVMHRDWPGQWRFISQPQATLLGLGNLAVPPVPSPAEGSTR